MVGAKRHGKRHQMSLHSLLEIAEEENSHGWWDPWFIWNETHLPFLSPPLLTGLPLCSVVSAPRAKHQEVPTPD